MSQSSQSPSCGRLLPALLAAAALVAVAFGSGFGSGYVSASSSDVIDVRTVEAVHDALTTYSDSVGKGGYPYCTTKWASDKLRQDQDECAVCPSPFDGGANNKCYDTDKRLEGGDGGANRCCTADGSFANECRNEAGICGFGCGAGPLISTAYVCSWSRG